MQILPVFIAAVLCALQTHSQNTSLVRQPALSSDGSRMAFSYQGDIWVSNSDGSDPRRLTVHESYEQMPHWSPDDSQLAFTGSRFGNGDIFVIDAGGGRAKRITYHSADDDLTGWSKEQGLIFSTARNFKLVEWNDEIHSVPASGGTPARLLDAFGQHTTASPNGKLIAFERGVCRLSREDYRGAANRDIWMFNTQTGNYSQLTNYNGNDFMPRWQNDSTLYWISARPEAYNVFRMSVSTDGSMVASAEQLTGFDATGPTAFDVARNGKLVCERLGTFYEGLPGSNLQPMAMTLPVDYRFDPEEFKTYRKNIDDYAISPNGNWVCLEIHGEMFIKPNDKDKKEAVDISENPNRDLDPAWLNDSTLIYSSDRSGNYELYLAKSTDENKTDLYGTLKRTSIRLTETSEDERHAHISPDGKKIMYQLGHGKLVVADIDENGQFSHRRVLADSWARLGSVSWSPDSRWLAYSQPNLDFNHEIFIIKADGSQGPFNVSMHPRGDYQPVWGAGGKRLFFVSERARSGNDIWYAWLTEEDWEKTKRDREEGWYFEPDEPEQEEEKEDEKEKEEDKMKEEMEPMEVDTANIYRRLVHLTSLPGNEGNVATDKEGKYVFFTAVNTLKDRSDLYKIKFDGEDISQITSGGLSPNTVRLGPEEKKVYYEAKGNLRALIIKNNKNEKYAHIAQMKVNHLAERREVFDEAWRTLDKRFYDPQFHGRDWDALKGKYKPLALAASTAQDFRFMFNRMLGQLNASHMGLYGSDPEETQSQRTGLIGAELQPLKTGVKVAGVITGSPADKVKSKLEVGDVITAVNGEAVTDSINFYKLLLNASKDLVLLEVENDGKREVAIRPTRGLGREKYREFVEEKRKLVAQYSNNTLGYIHVKGMNWSSFERFERELAASASDKDGLLIDVRYNGGGWTTDYLLTVLNVRQHAYTIPRGAADSLEQHKEFSQYYPYGERLPYAAWTKPVSTLCNSRSYSNAEIFSHAFKTLNLGTLVGEPTFGAVISTGGKSLLDGSFVRTPFRAWYVKATDENMEGQAAIPDIVVENDPDARAKNQDTQLKRAVEKMMQ